MNGQSYSRINKLFDGDPAAFYHSFRIPAIVRATGSVLLAFCEGRVGDNDDWGNINLVYKRSTDNGLSWSSLMQLVGVGPGSWTNPTAVYEAPWSGHPNGRVHLFFNWHDASHTSMATIGHGDRRTYYTWSDDDGQTWQPYQNLTSTLLPPTFTWDAVGPGNGMQKVLAPNVGRLIVPAIHRNFHSDDHGATWHYTMMPTVSTANITSESTIAECNDGTLYRNDRATGPYWTQNSRRWISYGEIGNFPTPTPQLNLLDPRSQASMLRYNLSAPGRLIFLNSDSTATRRRMKVRMSYDDGQTWPRERWLYVGTPPDNHATIGTAESAGKGGYSSMTKTADFRIAALVEVNESFTSTSDSYSLDFHRFDLAWIRNGQSDLVGPELTTTVTGSLPNVTDGAFVFAGTGLLGVTEVILGGRHIVSQSASTWESGWFDIVSATRIEVHPPQAMPPGTYPLVVEGNQYRSQKKDVSITLSRTPVLHAVDRPLRTFRLFASLGSGYSAQTRSFLGFSTSPIATIYPGIVALGIGNAGTSLFVANPVAFDPQSSTFSWTIPDLTGYPPLYFQAAHIDLLGNPIFPLQTTNVELVTP
ncbi:MAG: exo-alpha-sialidase [Planctomycetes bacterium]|nr:exo-alpha-sialidase [Planctomycetota bacterium]